MRSRCLLSGGKKQYVIDLVEVGILARFLRQPRPGSFLHLHVPILFETFWQICIMERLHFSYRHAGSDLFSIDRPDSTCSHKLQHHSALRGMDWTLLYFLRLWSHEAASLYAGPFLLKLLIAGMGSNPRLGLVDRSAAKRRSWYLRARSWWNICLLLKYSPGVWSTRRMVWLQFESQRRDTNGKRFCDKWISKTSKCASH